MGARRWVQICPTDPPKPPRAPSVGRGCPGAFVGSSGRRSRGSGEECSPLNAHHAGADSPEIGLSLPVWTALHLHSPCLVRRPAPSAKTNTALNPQGPDSPSGQHGGTGTLMGRDAPGCQDPFQGGFRLASTPGSPNLRSTTPEGHPKPAHAAPHARTGGSQPSCRPHDHPETPSHPPTPPVGHPPCGPGRR